MANFVKLNEPMYVQQDTSSFGLGSFQATHMQQQQPPPPSALPPPPNVHHSLLNCSGGNSLEKPAYGLAATHQLHLAHSFIHHHHQQQQQQQQLQQLHHHQHQHQHHHQFLARQHHLASHGTAMHYHHDEKRGKRAENAPTAYFPTGIIPLNASK